jgi:hypothetical protein
VATASFVCKVRSSTNEWAPTDVGNAAVAVGERRAVNSQCRPDCGLQFTCRVSLNERTQRGCVRLRRSREQVINAVGNDNVAGINQIDHQEPERLSLVVLRSRVQVQGTDLLSLNKVVYVARNQGVESTLSLDAAEQTGSFGLK